MAYKPPNNIGQHHKVIPEAKKYLTRFSYGQGLGTTDEYTAEFGAALHQFAQRVNVQVARGKRSVPLVSLPDKDTGWTPFDWTVQDQMGLIAASSPPPMPEFRNIWFLSAPGSGAAWWVGPSFELGEWVKRVLHLNHQPLGFPGGGYLGLMGGDPGLSYNEVIHGQYLELMLQLDINPYVQEALQRVADGLDTDIEFWFSGYSQSADGMEDALEKLFGNGGRYAPLRDRINGVIQFGNPSTERTGIARKVRPGWLRALVRNVNTKGDFYAFATDSIRPLFYDEIVEAETSLSFAGHIVKIALPVILNLFGGFAGLLQGDLFKLVNLVKQDVDVHEDDEDDHQLVHDRLIALLSPMGILTNIPELLGLLMALPGLQAHGEYHLPKVEFGGRTGIQVGCDLVAAYRRPV